MPNYFPYAIELANTMIKSKVDFERVLESVGVLTVPTKILSLAYSELVIAKVLTPLEKLDREDKEKLLDLIHEFWPNSEKSKIILAKSYYVLEHAMDNYVS